MNLKILASLQTIAAGLGEMNHQVVFVGGAVVGLYDIHPAAEEPRMTEDVDIILEIRTSQQFYEMENRLRAMSFNNDISQDAPICRWIFREIKIDIMPLDDKILGFSNRWYQAGFHCTLLKDIGSGISIRILPVAYFIAAKFEAVFGRGLPDIRFSHDFEDIIFLIDNSDRLVDACLSAPEPLRIFLKKSLLKLTALPVFKEAVGCMVSFGDRDRLDSINVKITLLQNGL